VGADVDDRPARARRLLGDGRIGGVAGHSQHTPTGGVVVGPRQRGRVELDGDHDGGVVAGIAEEPLDQGAADAAASPRNHKGTAHAPPPVRIDRTGPADGEATWTTPAPSRARPGRSGPARPAGGDLRDRQRQQAKPTAQAAAAPFAHSKLLAWVRVTTGMHVL
jgi:hypothetical protein